MTYRRRRYRKKRRWGAPHRHVRKTRRTYKLTNDDYWRAVNASKDYVARYVMPDYLGRYIYDPSTIQRDLSIAEGVLGTPMLPFLLNTTVGRKAARTVGSVIYDIVGSNMLGLL